jgi:hypothetical protein
VVIRVQSSDPDAAELLFGSLTFTSTNWNQNQTVSVIGRYDRDTRDESVTVTLSVDRTRSDDDFDDVPNQAVAVRVRDVIIFYPTLINWN